MRPAWMVLGLALLLFPTVAAQAFDFAPRIAYGPDPATSMTVVWSAPAGARTHRLEWGPTSALGSETQGTQRDLGNLQVWPVYAELTGLSPATDYHYVVRMGNASDQVRSFRTAPAAASEFAFLAWGDQSSPGAPEAAGDSPRRVMELAQQQDAAFALVLGDLAYAGREEDWWNQYVEQASMFGATRPFMTVPGNHDLEGFGPDGYRTRFRMPSQGDDRWYSFRYGSAVFVGLDVESFCEGDDRTSGRAPFQGDCALGVNPRQIDFLRAELTKARADGSITWVVVYHHFGVYSQGRHGSNALMREHWAPLYDEFRVDLVLQAHDHLYLRSKPLRAGEVDDSGTTYLVVGTGGARLYRHGEVQAWEAAFQDRVHGLLSVRVTSTELAGRFISIEGETLDEFALEPRWKHARPSAPIPVGGPVLSLFALFVLARGLRTRG